MKKIKKIVILTLISTALSIIGSIVAKMLLRDKPEEETPETEPVEEEA
ncbi:MAG TPA: hypothetical protein PL124_05030 [Candidatus Cloacimonadota bacterium]|nr:hypothetical protein [Candidatus Cloacimonadota bacterium]HPS38759.1 hypothetical protein [Candidatus Cloacimonadota bacterium]